MKNSKEKESITNYFSNINEKKFEDAFAIFHPEMVWTIMGTANVSGDYDVRKISLGFKSLFRKFSSFAFEIHEMTGEGNRVSVIAESHAIRKISNKKYNNHYHFLFEFQDDKLIKVREFLDTIHANWIEEP